MLLSEFIDTVRTHMILEGLSPRYTEQVVYALRRVAAWRDKPVAEFGRRDAEAYEVMHKLEGVTTGALYADVCAFRRLSKSAVREGECATDWGRELKAPKVKRPLPAALSPEEALRIINVWHPVKNGGKINRYVQMRNRTMMILALFTGARAKEIVGLNFEHVDLGQGVISFVHTKGEEPRMVPIHPELKEALEAYIAVRLEIVPVPIKVLPALFVSDARNCPGRWKRINSNTYSCMFRAHTHTLGLDERAHSMRHTFATQLLENDVNLATIQQLLGHKNIETTTIYLKVGQGAKRKAVEGLTMKLK